MLKMNSNLKNIVDVSSLKILIYISDNFNNETIKLLSNSSLQIKYSEIKIKTDINKNNISSNLKKINDNSGLINTNIRNISFNTGLITNIKNNLAIINDDIYNETFIFSNRTTLAESQPIFKKIIDFNFSKNGIFNILTNCNYEYDTKYNFNHTYYFYNNDNDELLKKEIIANNMISNVVKDEFKFENINDISSLKILIYISDNFNNETIKLLSNSSLQIKYSEIKIKTDINKNNISSNLSKIDTNKNNISSNLININTNEDNIAYNLNEINHLKNNKPIQYLKNVYNILFYDRKTQVSFRNYFF